MDSQDKGESNIRQRQESLARRVGEALDQLKPNEARDCPDAEIIAAYAEQALAPDETARWEGHFASCARCRNVLRVLAASSEAPLAEKEVSHLGEIVAAARAPVAAPVAIDRQAQGAARPRRSEWRTRWLAPAIGAAAVLVVWFAMRPPWRATNQRSSQVLVAQAPKEELPPSAAPPAVDQALKEPAAKDQKTEPAPEQERSLAKALPPNSSANAPAKKGAADSVGGGAAQDNQDKLSASAKGSANATPERKELDRPLNGREIPAPAAPPPPPPAAPQAKAKAAPNAAPGESLQAEASSNSVASAPAQQKQAGAVQAQTGARRDEESAKKISPPALQRQALAAFGAAQMGVSLLKAPDGLVVWRAGKGGAIERSNDAGKTWTAQMSPSAQDWLGGAAFSGTVCWLAGRRGAIARTVDGQHWDLIMPPGQAAGAGGVQPDWIGITALDARAATVTSADGHKFTTPDGGMTWQAQ